MRHLRKMVAALSFVVLACILSHSQDQGKEINSNLGAAVSLPVSTTSDFVKVSWGISGGAGYNFSEHHAIVGEFMWSALYPSDSGLQPIREGLQNNSVTGHSNLYALTANYRYELRHKTLGTYIIGGGGWYYRTMGFTGPVTSPAGIACTPSWLWWGFKCSSGTVVPGQSLGGYTSSVFGGNVGVGFTKQVADPGYRLYIEPRYHYAPTKNGSTQLVEITFGIRY
ncbi:MAG TPA: outer membrane beta-barrel protein [Terriglobales bacterium]